MTKERGEPSKTWVRLRRGLCCATAYGVLSGTQSEGTALRTGPAGGGYVGAPGSAAGRQPLVSVSGVSRRSPNVCYARGQPPGAASMQCGRGASLGGQSRLLAFAGGSASSSRLHFLALWNVVRPRVRFTQRQGRILVSLVSQLGTGGADEKTLREKTREGFRLISPPPLRHSQRHGRVEVWQPQPGYSSQRGEGDSTHQECRPHPHQGTTHTRASHPFLKFK